MIQYVLSVTKLLGNIPNTKRELVLFLGVGSVSPTDDRAIPFIGAMAPRQASGKCICERLPMTKRTVKKVGDLIQEKEHPEYGRALIVEVGDRRKKEGYRVLMEHIGIHWLNKNYVECKCKVSEVSDSTAS